MPAPILCCSRPVDDRSLQRLDHAQRHVGRSLRPDQVMRKYREFIAAEARQQIAAAHRAQQPLRHDDEHLIADCMAVNIVDLLEAVQVEQKYSMHRAAARRRSERGLQRIVVLPPIRQPGKSVLEGQFPCMFLGRHAPPGFFFLFDETPDRKHQQAQHEQAAEQQHLIDFDGLFLGRCVVLIGEDVDLPRIEYAHQHDEPYQR